MNRGKHTCKILKEIRRQIAEKNDIEYITSECHFQGECKGTCPHCEAEVRYLENELQKRKQLGKAVAIAGISLGVIGSFAACNSPKQQNTEQKIVADSVGFDTISSLSNCTANTIPVPPKDINLHPFIPFAPPVLQGEVIEPDTIIHVIRTLNFAEVQPQFPGGNEELFKYLQENMIYPPKAKEDSIQGKVVVKFVVDISGNNQDINIVKSLTPECDMEAIRLVKDMPKWIPGSQDGKAVAVYYTLPIQFKLSE